MFADDKQRMRQLSESHTNVSEHFRKVAEDFRGRSEDVSIIHQQL